jgi:membrane protease YdiL (CAAX protease family)
MLRGYYLGVLAVCTFFLLMVIYKERWTLTMLNIRFDNLRKTFLPYAAFTVLGVIVLVGVMKMLGIQSTAINPYVVLFEWSIPIGAVQEFLYRGFLMRELHRVCASIPMIITVNALLFMLLHILYNPPILILPLTFIGGIGFAWMYEKYPNLLLIALSHGILNFFAIRYGFF